jgi:hypothetical protein
MTLIVGTTHWNGICLNSDTRATDRNTGKYSDNAQKLSHIHGGIGMVASRDRQSAILLRETIRKRLDEFEKTNIQFDHSVDLSNVMETLLTEALKQTRQHELHKTRPIFETDSFGLIGTTIPDQKLRLNSIECKNLVSIIKNGSQGEPINQRFEQKYMTQIESCAEGKRNSVEFDEFPQSILFKYDLKLFDDESLDIYSLDKVPFGEIEAMGSGSGFDYSSTRDRVLFFVLFNGDFKDVGLGSLHLSMIHELAEKLAPPDKIFNIKTFGGAIIPGFIHTLPDGNGNTVIEECDLGSKTENRIVSKTFHKGKDLWVITRDGKEVKLEPFPDKVDITPGMYW